MYALAWKCTFTCHSVHSVLFHTITPVLHICKHYAMADQPYSLSHFGITQWGKYHTITHVKVMVPKAKE